MWLKLERAFSMHSPPALSYSSPARNVFASSVKSTCPTAQNAFVVSNKSVRRQCELYFEVSSREYLVASDERVGLQCELMFGGE